jgi:hypothetical protein
MTTSTYYTVLLQRPDWTDCETYMTCVPAANPVEALASARAEVCSSYGTEYNPLDYLCLLLIAGEHNDLNPEL